MAKKKSKLSDKVEVYTGPTPAQERKWKIEEAMRTMERAEEIKKDASLMKDVKAAAKQKMADLKKIC